MKPTGNVMDRVINDIGGKPSRPAKWKQHYYISQAAPPIGGKREDGWVCSYCGKHSWTKKKVCDGCNSYMTDKIIEELKEEMEKL